MKALHLIHARHAKPFIKVLRDRGAPIKLLAKQSGLPLHAALTGEGVIGGHSLWQFVEFAAEREQNDVFGYECAVATPVLENGKFGVMPLRQEYSLKDLLLNTDISVREIAHDLGYRHPSNFTRAFVRMSGLSPQAYRNGLSK